MKDVCQYSIDIRDCDELSAEKIREILEDAGFEVFGCEWSARWTAKEYGYGADEEE